MMNSVKVLHARPAEAAGASTDTSVLICVSCGDTNPPPPSEQGTSDVDDCVESKAPSADATRHAGAGTLVPESGSHPPQRNPPIRDAVTSPGSDDHAGTGVHRQASALELSDDDGSGCCEQVRQAVELGTRPAPSATGAGDIVDLTNDDDEAGNGLIDAASERQPEAEVRQTAPEITQQASAATGRHRSPTPHETTPRLHDSAEATAEAKSCCPPCNAGALQAQANRDQEHGPPGCNPVPRVSVQTPTPATPDNHDRAQLEQGAVPEAVHRASSHATQIRDPQASAAHPVPPAHAFPGSCASTSAAACSSAALLPCVLPREAEHARAASAGRDEGLTVATDGAAAPDSKPWAQCSKCNCWRKVPPQVDVSGYWDCGRCVELCEGCKHKPCDCEWDPTFDYGGVTETAYIKFGTGVKPDGTYYSVWHITCPARDSCTVKAKKDSCHSDKARDALDFMEKHRNCVSGAFDAHINVIKSFKSKLSRENVSLQQNPALPFRLDLMRQNFKPYGTWRAHPRTGELSYSPSLEERLQHRTEFHIGKGLSAVVAKKMAQEEFDGNRTKKRKAPYAQADRDDDAADACIPRRNVPAAAAPSAAAPSAQLHNRPQRAIKLPERFRNNVVMHDRDEPEPQPEAARGRGLPPPYPVTLAPPFLHSRTAAGGAGITSSAGPGNAGGAAVGAGADPGNAAAGAAHAVLVHNGAAQNDAMRVDSVQGASWRHRAGAAQAEPSSTAPTVQPESGSGFQQRGLRSDGTGMNSVQASQQGTFWRPQVAPSPAARAVASDALGMNSVQASQHGAIWRPQVDPSQAAPVGHEPCMPEPGYGWRPGGWAGFLATRGAAPVAQASATQHTARVDDPVMRVLAGSTQLPANSSSLPPLLPAPQFLKHWLMGDLDRN